RADRRAGARPKSCFRGGGGSTQVLGDNGGSMSALDARNRYIDSLDHIDSAYTKIKGMVGRHGALTFPDVYKLTEGLFLNGWTYWEAFLRDVLWNDLATDTTGVLLQDMAVKGRRANGPYRLAELILNHPDSPDKFVEWSDYGVVKKRAT